MITIRRSLLIQTFLLFICTISFGQKPSYSIITRLADMKSLLYKSQSEVNSVMKKKGWVFQRNIPSNEYGMEYIVWGRPNRSNAYLSESIMIGFKKDDRNIVLYGNMDYEFYKNSHNEIYKEGYSLSSRDHYKDADIEMYSKSNNQIMIFSKPTYKKGMSFSIYSYYLCYKKQITKENVIPPLFVPKKDE